MADFYTDLQATATGILDEFSQGEVILTRHTIGPSDPATPWIPGADVTTDYELKATVRGVSFQHVDGTLILASDEVVTCSADVVAPEMSDTLTIDGNPRVIKMIRNNPSAGTVVAHQLFIEG